MSNSFSVQLVKCSWSCSLNKYKIRSIRLAQKDNLCIMYTLGNHFMDHFLVFLSKNSFNASHRESPLYRLKIICKLYFIFINDLELCSIRTFVNLTEVLEY